MSAPVLFIGGMDSSGGAGLLRDCTVAQDLGAAVRVAVTAVTAQNDRLVGGAQFMAAPLIAAQIALAGPVGAIKIGMLGTAAITDTVAGALPAGVPLVLDPVLVSSSGHALLDDDGITAMLTRLVPRCDLLTPNLPELAVLARHLGLPQSDEKTCAQALLARGCAAVLVKGGHDAPGRLCQDMLYRSDGLPIAFSGPRIEVRLRGTGCHLASAIAVNLGAGMPLGRAIAKARDHLQARFMAAVQPSGQG